MKLSWIGSLVILANSILLAHGDGAIQLRNSTLTKASLAYVGGAGSGPIDVPASFPMVYGVFVARSNECPELVLPLGTASATAGLIDAPNPFLIPGTNPGDTVKLSVKAWRSQFGLNHCQALWSDFLYFGESGPVSLTLGDSNSPTVVWQSASGTSPNRLKALSIGMLSPPPVYVNVNDILAVEGISGEATATFTVTRSYGWVGYSCCTNLPLTGSFTTENGTAIAGADYVATTGSFDFEPGRTNTTIAVTLLSDPVVEEEETFTVRIDTVTRETGTARITEARLIRVEPEQSDLVVTALASSGRRFAVESSLDLIDWTVVDGLADITGTGEPLSLRHLGGAQSGQTFYRMRLFE
jgi:predicted RNA-binding protein with TRAM domain